MNTKNTPIRGIRISDPDWQLIREAAAAQDLNRGQYIRRVCNRDAKRVLAARDEKPKRPSRRRGTS